MRSIHTYDYPIHTTFFRLLGLSQNDLCESTARRSEVSLEHESRHMTSTDHFDR